jgi:hypothetical protein
METRANVSKQGSSGGNYETTNQLIGLLLINEECRRRWVQEQQPSIESFPSHYGLLLAAILERQGEKLTWQYFADFMKARNISKIERQGQEHQYNILAIAKPNPADFDVFAKRMTGEKMREEVSKAILPLAQVAKSKDPSQVRAVAEEMIAAADKAEVKAEPNEDQQTITMLLHKRLSLQAVYDKAPPDVQSLTRLLYTLNPILPTPAHLLTALAVSGAVLGKRIAIENFGRTYYTSIWLAHLYLPLLWSSDVY